MFKILLFCNYLQLLQFNVYGQLWRIVCNFVPKSCQHLRNIKIDLNINFGKPKIYRFPIGIFSLERLTDLEENNFQSGKLARQRVVILYNNHTRVTGFDLTDFEPFLVKARSLSRAISNSSSLWVRSIF